MKHRQVTKIDKGNKTMSKKFNDDAMSKNCVVIIVFPIYDQFGIIWKPDSRNVVCKTHIFINSNLSSYKNWKQI